MSFFGANRSLRLSGDSYYVDSIFVYSSFKSDQILLAPPQVMRMHYLIGFLACCGGCWSQAADHEYELHEDEFLPHVLEERNVG
jgi:hypothetical protein